jgi:hypothetical protein
VSLNNEKSCREIGEDKIAVCEKTAGLRSGTFSSKMGEMKVNDIGTQQTAYNQRFGQFGNL